MTRNIKVSSTLNQLTFKQKEKLLADLDFFGANLLREDEIFSHILKDFVTQDERVYFLANRALIMGERILAFERYYSISASSGFALNRIVDLVQDDKDFLQMARNAFETNFRATMSEYLTRNTRNSCYHLGRYFEFYDLDRGIDGLVEALHYYDSIKSDPEVRKAIERVLGKIFFNLAESAFVDTFDSPNQAKINAAVLNLLKAELLGNPHAKTFLSDIHNGVPQNLQEAGLTDAQKKSRILYNLNLTCYKKAISLAHSEHRSWKKKREKTIVQWRTRLLAEHALKDSLYRTPGHMILVDFDNVHLFPEYIFEEPVETDRFPTLEACHLVPAHLKIKKAAGSRQTHNVRANTVRREESARTETCPIESTTTTITTSTTTTMSSSATTTTTTLEQDTQLSIQGDIPQKDIPKRRRLRLTIPKNLKPKWHDTRKKPKSAAQEDTRSPIDEEDTAIETVEETDAKEEGSEEDEWSLSVSQSEFSETQSTGESTSNWVPLQLIVEFRESYAPLFKLLRKCGVQHLNQVKLNAKVIVTTLIAMSRRVPIQITRMDRKKISVTEPVSQLLFEVHTTHPAKWWDRKEVRKSFWKCISEWDPIVAEYLSYLFPDGYEDEQEEEESKTTL